MKNIQYVMDVLNRFKAEGFDISIDDFGTGHSSMSYLKRFPIDELKIDKSFVDDLPHDLNDAAITKAIIALSKSLGYINVAEGIENEKQEMFLQDNGCEIGQGYYFCKPLRKKELLQFLDERNI
jgi:EAL domain-containing protein (putative c-di-GMP-specific phosphodiesterase class I)